MTTAPIPINPIPSLPVDKFLTEDGEMADSWRLYFEDFTKLLQANFSNEGLIAPSQTGSAVTGNIQVIQNNQLPNGQYTCGGGRFLYNSSLDTMMVSILAAGVPTFRTITVT